MVNRQDQIEIEIAVPNTESGTNIETEMGKEITYEWKELGYMDSYSELRATFDEIIGNKVLTSEGKEGKKGGFLYIDMQNHHTNNSTLRFAFNQPKFYEKLWNNEEAVEKLAESAQNTFADINSDQEALLASINAYYNLFTTAEG